MTQHDDAMLELVAAHGLGAVDAASPECQTVVAHLRECAVCREEYSRAQAVAAALAASVAETPPVGLREKILQALPARPRGGTVTPLARRRAWFPGLAAAAAVLLIIGALWTLRHHEQTWTAACVPGAVGCHASGVLSMRGTNSMHLDLRGLAPLPAGKGYQTWVINPGAKPKPEPMVAVDAQGSGGVDIPSTAAKGTIVAVTVEPATGSQAPTSKPFLIATVE